MRIIVHRRCAAKGDVTPPNPRFGGFPDRLCLNLFQDSRGVRDVRFTATNRAQRGKLALTAAALGIGLLTSGCGYINSQQTNEQYQASDGIVTDLGPLKLSNFMIVSNGEDEPGRVIGAVYNSSSQDVKLTVNGAEGSQTEIPVKANSYVLLNNE